MRNIETFPSKQMYPYLSLDERKVAEFYHNIDRRRWLVWLKWLILINFSGQLMVSLGNTNWYANITSSYSCLVLIERDSACWISNAYQCFISINHLLIFIQRSMFMRRYVILRPFLLLIFLERDPLCFEPAQSGRHMCRGFFPRFSWSQVLGNFWGQTFDLVPIIGDFFQDKGCHSIIYGGCGGGKWVKLLGFGSH